MGDNTSTFMELTASIVSAYVRHNSVPSAELPALIGQVHTALTRVSSGHGQALANTLRPAISIKKSIAPDYIICLEDGKKFKSLKRHLRTAALRSHARNVNSMSTEAVRHFPELPAVLLPFPYAEITLLLR
jgi:predicted transcriptional regulator